MKKRKFEIRGHPGNGLEILSMKKRGDDLNT